MKIVLVSTFGTPAYGVSPYADQLLSSLSELCGSTDSVEALDYQKPYPDFLYPAKAPKRYRRDGLHWSKPWTWKCPINAPDIVHVQYWTQITAPYLLRFVRNTKLRGAHIVLTLHNVQPHEKTGFLQRSENALLNAADAIITHVEDERISSAFKKKHHVIPHGISFHQSTSPSKTDYILTGLSPRYRYILFFGNIRPYKGVIDLLEAWADISSQFPKHKLVVAGRVWSGSTALSRLSGRLLGLHEFEKEYRIACDKISEGPVQFIEDYLSEEYIDAICKIAELAVFAYRSFNAQSGAATRVAGFGKTLLVSDKGGLSQLTLSKRNVFRAGDPADLKAKLSFLLNRHLDQIYQDEGSQRHHLYTFSWATVAAKHIALYNMLLEQ